MNRKAKTYTNCLFLSLALILVMSESLIALPQKNVSGVINQTRSRVESIGTDYVVVNNVTGFSTGDTVLLIQMKGEGILTTNDGNFGMHDQHVGDVGYYEFIIVQAVNAGSRRLTFFNLIEGDYAAESFVQVIKVESYEALRVTGDITAPSWDPISGTGGVIAIFASDKIILEANISVEGKGFRGGTPSLIAGICTGSPPVAGNSYFPASSNLGGRKGEGYASHDSENTILISSLYSKGPGSFSTGGGGGWGNLSGAGGGGSYSLGGIGGQEAPSCAVPSSGGRGGRAIAEAYTDISQPTYTDPILMGGGGGSGGYKSGSAPAGGNGGGIIFIMTDSIYGNGHSISVNGMNVNQIASLTAGGAGGGAAGAMVISANGYGSSQLVLSAEGGNGGGAANRTGVGGGGSGGRIYRSPADYSTLTQRYAGGENGSLSPSGDNGPAPLSTHQIRLNGFLFNTVVTLKSGFLLDSICAGQVPPQLMASKPVGGTIPFTTYWEKSYNEVNWAPITGTSTGNIFTPAQAETVTLWIRRRIIDGSLPAIEDISKPVKIIVHPNIINFEIAHDNGDTICFNQDVTVIEPLVPVPGGGNSIYSYEWHSGSDGVTYNQSLLGSGSTYDPASPGSTTWYRRTVMSGACIDSSSSVRITVLPVIAGNSVGPDQIICEGALFENLNNTGSPLTGGDGNYKFKWEASTDNANWTHSIGGITNQQSYNPDESSADFPALTPKYYRRIVYSGEANCCTDISAPVSLVMQPKITNNLLSVTAQTVCEGVPEVSDVIGSLPVGGTGIYTYSWEILTTPPGTWRTLSDSTRRNLSVKVLYETTSFRRVVNSGVCSATSSDIFTVTVQPQIAENIIRTLSGRTDTTICRGQSPSRLTGPGLSGGLGAGSYTYLWEVNSSGVNWQPATLVNNQANYDPPILTETTRYRRTVFSGECESESNTIAITVLLPIAGNVIVENETVCYGTAPAELHGVGALTGGDDTYRYLWQSDSNPLFTSPVNVGTEPAFQPGNLTSPRYYRRLVLSGMADCCSDTSNTVIINIWDLPEASMLTSQYEQICEGEPVDIELNITSGLAPYQVSLSDGISNIPLFTHSDEGLLTHQLVPGYNIDRSLIYTIVSVEDANGYLATKRTGRKDVGFYERPSSFAGNYNEVCGYDYQLNAVASVGSGAWSWAGPQTIFNNGAAPDATMSFNQFTAGDTTLLLWWKEVNVLARCADSASVKIKLWKEPDIAYAGRDSILLPFQGDVELFASRPIIGKGTWTSPVGVTILHQNDPKAMATGLVKGDNHFEWSVSNGACKGTVDAVDLIVPGVRLITGFSPNGDGINDYFVIDGLVEWDGGIVDNEFVVTDMTGVVLYKETNYGNDWDGRDMRGKPLPSGTYYYFISVKYSKEVLLKGFVVIKRD